MSGTSPNAFRCDRVTCAFDTREGRVVALDEVTFTVARREFVCVVGPTGCGKTTLLRAIAGLVQPVSGDVVFEAGVRGHGAPASLVFQEHGLMPWLTVLDNVTCALHDHAPDQRARRERGLALLAGVGLAPFAQRYPHELSMGMRQRVALARALGADRPILLMDEPFGALDAQTRLVLQQELIAVWHSRQLSIVFVTHDIREAVTLGDRVLVLSGRPGRILEDVRVPAGHPRDPFAEQGTGLEVIEREIWARLESQVRRGLALS